jgi:hypothetical protein
MMGYFVWHAVTHGHAAAPSPLLIVTTNYDDLMERAYRPKQS